MPGFGAERQFARGQSSAKKLKSLTVHMPEEEKGDVRVEHEYQDPHAPQTFKFGAAEKGGLAEHLQKHLAIVMPGRAKGTVASPAAGEVSKDESE
jgi:hypothetical protein